MVVPKLKSRGPIDVPERWTVRPGIVSALFSLLGLFLAGGVGLAVLWALVATGTLSIGNAILIGMGGASLVVAWGALTWAGQRVDL